MIVRILGEGQYEVPDQERDALEALDGNLVAAVEAQDEPAFEQALAALTAAVRRLGQELPTDTLAPSDLVVPFDDASLSETEALLAGSVGSADDD